VLLVTVLVVTAFRRQDLEGALWRCVLASLILTASVYPFAIESLRSLKLSPRLAQAAQAICADPAVMTLGYREPSLVFLTGTNLAATPTRSLRRAPPCRSNRASSPRSTASTSMAGAG
jgi:hypothetical protein